MTRPTLLLALALAAAPCSALEVSLEENKADRGNIGYVDLQKVFRLFPGTKKAKESFAALVKEAEDNISIRKGELLALRAEISRLVIEREMLLKTPVEPAVPPPVPPAPAPVAVSSPTAAVEPPPAPAPAPLPPPAVEASTSSLVESAPKNLIESLPGFTKAAAPAAVAASTPLAEAPLPTIPSAIPEEPGNRRREQEPLILQLPGSATSFLEAPPAAEAPRPPEPPPLPAPAPSSAAAPGRIVVEKPFELVPTSPAPLPGLSSSVSDRLAEVEAQLAAKKSELERKEAELREHQAQVEKNLIDIESRRSEILLGRIYAAVQEVAREAGVSVVVDKSQILFGQNTVDLTAKVIKKLEGMPQ